MKSRLSIVFVFSIFFSQISLFAQGNWRFSTGVTHIKVPFEYHHNLIIFPLEVNGATLNFILDTGSSHTVIFALSENDTLQLFNQKKIILRGLGNGEPIEAILSEDNSLKIKNISGQNQSIYLIINEKFDLSSRIGKTIHGIIGTKLLEDIIVKINYNKKILTFYNPDFFPYKKVKHFSKIPLYFNKNKPYIQSIIKINDSIPKETIMLIDSGNTDALWVFEDKEKNIICPNKFFIDHLGEGFSGSIEGKRTIIEGFSFGNFNFKKPSASFLDSIETVYARSFENRNGSIGNQILNRFEIVFDYPNKQMFLKKTKNFKQVFRYNRAGIELSYVGKTLVKIEQNKRAEIMGMKNADENQNVVFEINYRYVFKPVYGIYRVQKNSPSEKVGLQVNDILVSINGKPAYEYKLEEITALFQDDEGKNIKMVIERNGKIIYFKFVLANPI